MKRLLIILAAIVVLLLIFAVVGKKMGWIGKEEVSKVSAEQAEKREIIGIVSASGKIHPETEVKISPDVPGEIIELYVEEGDSVKKGQLLLKIKADDYESAISRSVATYNNTRAGVAQAQARISQAQAQVSNAESELKRSRELYDEKLISEREFNAAELTYNNAKAELQAAQQSGRAAEYTSKSVSSDVKQARDSYNKTIVRSPMSGIISQLNVEEGERVVGTSQMAGTEMLRVADMKKMECRIEVSENDIVRVDIGDSCQIEVDAYYGQLFKGIVTQISNLRMNTAVSGADQVTNFEVTVNILPESYAELTDKRFPFRPGMSATVDIITERIEDQLSVPIQSVTARTEKEVDDLIAEAKQSETDDDEAADSTANEDTERKSARYATEKKEYVFAVKNGKTAILPVKTDIQDDKYIVITDGLTEQDTVVTGPYSAISKSLKWNEKVEIVESGKLYE